MKTSISFCSPVLLVMALSSGCRNAPSSAEAAEPVPVQVRTIQVEPADVPVIYEATGTVRARTAAVIASKVMGYVREVRVQTGDAVRAGQPLVLVDARDLDAGYRQAEAARQEAVSAQSEVEQAVASAKANLELAKTTFERMSILYRSKSISDQEYDEASAKIKVAQAGYDAVVSKRAQIAARFDQAEEAVRAARVTRSYAELTAPFAGTVTERRVEPGNLATPGAPLLTIEQAGAYRLEVPVEEALLAAIRTGQSITVKFDFQNDAVEGTVVEIVPSVDSASRTFLVKIGLPVVAHLRSGVFGRAQFSRGARTVLAVPQGAVSEFGQVESVLVAEDGHARSRLITTGHKSQDRVEVLSGLRAGDRIIYPHPARLADGARVVALP
jgi:membrane fusion protein, multidrug efflux system